MFKSQFKTEKVTSKNKKNKKIAGFIFIFLSTGQFWEFYFYFYFDRPTLDFWKFSRKSEN